MIAKQQLKFQQQAIIFQRRIATAIAFLTTMFFFWIEEVKAFSTTHLIFNKNVLLFIASGAHSLTNKWKTTSSSFIGRKTFLGFKNKDALPDDSPFKIVNNLSFTSLKMAWSLPNPTMTSFSDFKTPLSFGGNWYNKVEPVAFSPVYDDDGIDYTFSSPADYWPSPIDSLSDDSSLIKTQSAPRRHIRLFRKIAGWLTRSPTTQRPVARLETVGTQASVF